METAYLATGFVGDPPDAIARWYKLQAGTYARISDEGVEFLNAGQLKIELYVGTSAEFIVGDGLLDDVDIINSRSSAAGS
tara:strand:- start:406 stop:645 length:240 start_codon:yes stop_codon:yes gene_type:complete